MIKNQIICSAIRLKDGRVFKGHRHHNCMATASDAHVNDEDIRGCEQGFIDARNQYVGRHEALQIQLDAGIESKQGGYMNKLYSEDLY